MKATRSKNGINVSQCKYVFDLFTEMSMLGYKSRYIPIKVGKKFEDLGKTKDIERYCEKIDILISY